MDIISSFLRLRGFLPLQRQPNPPLPQPPSLLGFPHELVLAICDYLDYADLACLSLCSKALYSVAGGNCIFIRRPQSDNVFRTLSIKSADVMLPMHKQRKAFLLRYIRDCPRFYICHKCAKMHTIANVPPAGPLYHAASRVKCWRKGQDYDYDRNRFENHLSKAITPYITSYALNFAQVQLVMAEHRQPGSGISLEALKLVELTRPMCCRPVASVVISYDPLIIEGQLYLRIQEWSTFDAKPTVISENVHIRLCAHDWIMKTYDQWKTELFMQENGSRQPQLRRCPKCDTEVILHYKRIAEQYSFAIVCTKWLHLGTGTDVKAHEWKKHEHGWAQLIDVAKDDQSIMQKFEGSAKISQWTRMEMNERLATADGRTIKESMVALHTQKFPYDPHIHRSNEVWVQQEKHKCLGQDC